jgi:hypothetical protein
VDRRVVPLVVLLVIGFGALTGCGTKQVQPQPSQLAPKQELYVGLHTANWEVRIRVEPLLPGDRPAAIKLIPHAGEIPAGTTLTVELSRPDGVGAAQRFEAIPVGNGDYKVDALPLTAGSWKIRVTVAAPGAAPETGSYQFQVPPS